MVEIDVHFPQDSGFTEDYQNKMKEDMKKAYGNLCLSLEKGNYVHPSISQLILCIDLESYINEFNLRWGTNCFLTKEKEYTSKAINLAYFERNERKVIIAVSLDLLPLPKVLNSMILSQFLVEKANAYLPDRFLNHKSLGIHPEDTENLDIIIEQCFSVWFGHSYANKFFQENMEDLREVKLSHSEHMINLKRNIRKLLYQVQSDNDFYNQNWNYVWVNYVILFTRFIQNLILDSTSDEKLKLQNPEEARICYEIVEEVYKNQLSLIHSGNIDLKRIKELFIELPELFGIHIEHAIEVFLCEVGFLMEIIILMKI